MRPGLVVQMEERMGKGNKRTKGKKKDEEREAGEGRTRECHRKADVLGDMSVMSRTVDCCRNNKRPCVAAGEKATNRMNKKRWNRNAKEGKGLEEADKRAERIRRLEEE